MKNMKKKGFTLVELLVVIAIIAILAVVSVVGYTAFVDKANASNDRSLVVQLNKTLIGGEFDGPHDAFEAVRASGFDVAKIEATAKDQSILWDNTAKEFFYTADDSRTGDIWIVDDAVSETYNTYYIGTTNIDIDFAAKIIVYTNDPALTISINAPQAHVEHEGKAGSINVIAVANNSYYENGLVNELNVTTGKIVVNGAVATLKVVGAANVNLAAGSEAIKVIVNDATATVKVDANAEIGNIATEKTEVLDKLSDIVDGADEVIVDTVVDSTKLGDFAGGFGTADFPYIIANVEQLTNISKHYGTYNYYKVADGITSLDLTGIGKINLHGSFDGNGVTFVNLTTALFQRVGFENRADDIKIANLEATMNVNDGSALVRNIFNSGKTTFENVTLHGYIEGLYNMGSFFNYGTANFDDIGADYTVEFINSKSDLTLVCTTGNGIGGMIGHGYEGTNNTITIICDDKSAYTGTMYTTSGSLCDSLMYMASNTSKFILNGNEVSGYDASFDYPSTKIVTVKPEADEDGYTVAPVEGAAKLVITIAPQVTAYDENGDKIANLSGMTWSFVHAETEVSGTDAVKVLDLITSASIVNGADHDYSYELVDGVLTIYSGRSVNYASGDVRLLVNQYDANGNLLAAGTIDLYKIVK